MCLPSINGEFHKKLYEYPIKCLCVRLILDSSAILSGVPLQGKLVSTPAIEQEFSPGGATYRTFQYLKKAGLMILDPSENAKKRVEDASKKTGDTARLSHADKEILALAYDLKDDGLLLSDDYSIQNVAREMDIPYSSVTQRGITKIVHWGYRCRGCGRYSENDRECQICGSPMKMIQKK